ncbi:MAG: putative tail completion protein [Prokaryotic dsDNA virus sp.]|uniref:phage tail protein n=1 Tax=Methylophaga sp. UBA2689 TaxID=1946878 RepID=UPI0011890BD2|nr:phage tail protein [Methylophaga sp. UBA2689]QDP47081.1 MAG: putative tail completion protein [Prokaryotic dsDNA virus sp.]|tara:strand:+ start:1623 stop:2189 length:567 start_codon:yes stop_codon:yes gene_type:complete
MADDPVKISGIEALRELLGDEVANRASASTVNKIAAQVNTAVRKSILGEWNIKAKTYNEQVKVIKGWHKNPRIFSILKATGAEIPLHRFGVTRAKAGKNKGRIAVKIKKGKPREVLRRAFLMRSGTTDLVMERVGRSRLPIEVLTAPAIPSLIVNDRSAKAMDEILKKAEDIGANEIEFFANKALGRQ